MSRPEIVITHWVHPEVVTHLSEFATVWAPPEGIWSREEVIARAHDAEALITCMADLVDDDLLDACPRLRVVSATLKGYDNIDVAACTRRGVWVTILPDMLTAPTAELAVGLAIGLMRQIRVGDAVVRGRGFSGWRPVLYGTGLHGTKIGVVGMGRLGRAVARRMAAFEPSELLYADHERLAPDDEHALGAHQAELATLLRDSELIVLTMPLSVQTRHLIGSWALAGVRPGAYLVNVCRGSVVDETEVLRALDDGRLSGYAADVFELEDWALPDRPRNIPDRLRSHPRTLFTPHLGSAVDDARREMSLAAADQTRQALQGVRPDHAVNAVALTG
jgi:phosphonate dehydrogenase